MATRQCSAVCHEKASIMFFLECDELYNVQYRKNVRSEVLTFLKNKKYIKIKSDRTCFVCKACIAFVEDKLIEEELNQNSDHDSDGPQLNVHREQQETNQEDVEDAVVASSSTSTDGRIQSLLKDIKLGKVGNSDLMKLAAAIGQAVKLKTPRDKDRKLAASSPSYSQEWENMEGIFKSFLEGCVDMRSKDKAENARRKVCFVKSNDCIKSAANGKHVSNIGLRDNIVQYYFSSSKTCTSLFGKNSGAGSYRTVLRAIEELKDENLQYPQLDLIVAIDNEQVVGSLHRVTYAGKQPVSVVTTVLAFTPQTGSTFQYEELKRTNLNPYEMSPSRREKTLSKYKQFQEERDKVVSTFRQSFVSARFEKIEKEGKLEDEHWVDELSTMEDFKQDIGIEYSRVPQQEATFELRDMPVLLCNPNSYKSLHHILERVQAESARSDKNRKWFVLVCDGLPFGLIDTLIKTTYVCLNCRETITKALGKKIAHTCDSLDMATGYKTPEQYKQKFDNIVLRPGNGHVELNASRLVLDLYFDIYIKSLAEMLNFKSPKALNFIRKGLDHHKTFQILRILAESLLDELLFAYFVQNSSSSKYSVKRFHSWIEKSNNPNVELASTLLFSILYPLFLFRSAIRQNNSHIALIARDKLSMIFYGSNCIKYQHLNTTDTLFCVTAKGNSKEFVTLQSGTRLGSWAGEGFDFLLEIRNKILKRWAANFGVPTASRWLEISQAFPALEKLKEDVFREREIPVEDARVRKVDLKREILEYRKILRAAKLFDKDQDKVVFVKNVVCPKQVEMLQNYRAVCKKNREQYDLEFINGKKPKLSVYKDCVLEDDKRSIVDIKNYILSKLEFLPETYAFECRKKLNKLSTYDDVHEFENFIEDEAELFQLWEIERLQVPNFADD